MQVATTEMDLIVNLLICMEQTRHILLLLCTLQKGFGNKQFNKFE